MFLDDYNEETFKREVRAEAFADGRKEGFQDGRKEGFQDGRKEGFQDGRKEGFQDGRKEGRKEERTDIATDMIMKGIFPVSIISEISKLSEDTIREMPAKLNVKL